MGAAGSGGAGLDVNEVFSTFLYEGNGSTRTITNGIDLAGEGGLTWIKTRENATYSNNMLYDTENGANYFLRTNGTNALTTASGFGLTAFNSDGFDMGTAYGNESNVDTASWTWRKAPKFFDVQTYTGSGSAKTVAHSLGSAPGMIIIKNTGVTDPWAVYHRANTAAPETDYLVLNTTAATVDSASWWNDTAPTSSVFTVGTDHSVNANGETYVAYLFAHNDGDGEFGPDADQDIIKCGSYTGNSSTNGPVIDLGFEPQWVMTKKATTTGQWFIWDSMRSMTAAGEPDYYLQAQSNNAEDGGQDYIGVLPNGFQPNGTGGHTNASNGTYIYIAIRRGPLAPPEAATEVFAVATGNEVTASKYNYHSGFPVDMAWRSVNTNERAYIADRLRGTEDLWSDSTRAEVNNTSSKFDDNVSWYSSVSTDTNAYSWMFRRAPSFFDVVGYTGLGANINTVKHNLGVKPEMIWIKGRDTTYNWIVYHDITSSGFKRNYLNTQHGDNTVRSYNSDYGLYSEPTDTQIQIDDLDADLYNGSGQVYITYLFASLAGISKVGSFTGNGSSQTIDCGFTSGASFILVKRTNSSGSWRYFDSKRGIVAGNDTSSKFNGSDAYVTNVDEVDPHNSGFIINQTSTSDLNVSNATYIFYAIASIA